MNAYIRSLAVAAVSAMALAVPVSGLAVEVYGKAILAVENIDQETNTEDYWQVASYDSRLGVRGEADTDVGGVKAIYNIEWQIDMADRSTTNENTASNNHIAARNQWVGLKGGYGEIIAGRIDTPLKRAQGKIDQFNDRDADIKYLMIGGEVRSNNILQYTTPKFGDAFSISLLVRPGEGTQAAGSTPPPGSPELQNGLTDATSISFTYSSGPLYLSLARDSDIDGIDVDTTRLVGQWTGDNFGVGLLHQTSEFATEDETVLIASAYYSLNDKFKLKAQVGSVENYAGAASVVFPADPTNVLSADGDSTALGLDYAFSKKTILGVLVASRSGGDNLLTDDLSRDTIGVNLEHNFE